MTQDFSENEIVYGDSWGLVHNGVLEDKKLEQMRKLHDKTYGKEGIARTPLKPVGRVEIEGVSYEARLDYGYLDKNAKVEVIGIDLGYIVVSKQTTEEI